MNKFFYNVAIAVPLRQTFTYHSNQQIKPGTRVAVKFGSKQKLGIVIGTINETVIKTKSIDFVLDDEPIFSRTELKILNWAAEYYHHPIGEVLISFIPTTLRQAKKMLEPINNLQIGQAINDTFKKIDRKNYINTIK